MYQETSKTENTSYVCKQSGIIVNGTVTKDVINGEIQSVNGVPANVRSVIVSAAATYSGESVPFDNTVEIKLN